MAKNKPLDRKTIIAALIGVSFFVLMLVPAFIGGPEPGGVKISKAQHMAHPPIDIQALTRTINPPDGLVLPVQVGPLGPRLVQAGIVDIAALRQYFQQTGQPLSDQAVELLSRGGQAPLVINRQDAAFLLTFFWGAGMANQNPILDKAAILPANEWKFGRKPGAELISSVVIFKLTADQQARVKQVAGTLYHPCSNASIANPDSPYSFATLGLLEAMASHDASPDAMYAAMKQVNAFWFPKQTVEQALFFVATQLKDYANIDARLMTSQAYFSAGGFGQIHAWLKEYNMLGDDADASLKC